VKQRQGFQGHQDFEIGHKGCWDSSQKGHTEVKTFMMIYLLNNNNKNCLALTQLKKIKALQNTSRSQEDNFKI